MTEKNEEQYKYLNDFWTVKDELGVAKTGDLLAEMALEAKPPFAVRVIGKWGAGKTSVLRRAFGALKGSLIEQAVLFGENKREIKKEEWDKLAFDSEERDKPLWDKDTHVAKLAEKSLCVWYSPWQHQEADNPLIPLLLEIQAQFKAKFESKIDELKDKAYKGVRQGLVAGLTLLERVADAAISFKAKKAVKVAQGTTKAVVEAWKGPQDELTRLSDGQRFHLLFHDAVENVLDGLARYVENKKKNDADNSKKDTEREPDAFSGRLIIFIDDLDRCEESVVVNLLEAIKLYLNTPSCVFILGIDDSAVLQALNRFWERSEDSNREYLEKLFQASVYVPVPLNSNIQKVIKDQLDSHKIPPNIAKESSLEIQELIESNPRKIKNFLNSLYAGWKLLGKEKLDDLDIRDGDSKEIVKEKKRESKDYKHFIKFILFTYLRLYHQPVWRLLERHPAALKALRLVLFHGSAEKAVSPDEEKSANKEKTDKRASDMEEGYQFMLKTIFFRAFSHVLKDSVADDEELQHRSLGIDKAAELFEERLDRRRADENFILLFKDTIVDEEVIEPEFLSITDKGGR